MIALDVVVLFALTARWSVVRPEFDPGSMTDEEARHAQHAQYS